MGLAERLQDHELDAALDVLDEEIERLTARALACALERDRIAMRLIFVKETQRANLERRRREAKGAA